jgi:hypothetical protein
MSPNAMRSQLRPFLARAVAGSLLFLLSACAAPERGASAPVKTSATEAPASFEQVFEIAEKAMNQMGHVENADPARGYISGVTPSGVRLEVDVIRVSGRSPEVQVQAQVPEGMAGTGDITEPERYLNIYRSLGGR